MSLANTFTKSGIKITGDADEADSLCMGIYGLPNDGNNGTGYIQNMWDTPGAPLARDLLLNPLGGNVAVGKTTATSALDISGSALVSGNVAIGKTSATVALDVSGGISHPVYAILQIPNFIINSTQSDLVFSTTNNTATDGTYNGNMNIGKGISLISTANTPGGAAVANSVIRIDYPGFYLINTKFNCDTAGSAGNIDFYIYIWNGSAWTALVSDQVYTTFTASAAANSNLFVQLYSTPPYYLKIQKTSSQSLNIGSGIQWTSCNIVKLG